MCSVPSTAEHSVYQYRVLSWNWIVKKFLVFGVNLTRSLDEATATQLQHTHTLHSMNVCDLFDLFWHWVRVARLSISQSMCRMRWDVATLNVCVNFNCRLFFLFRLRINFFFQLFHGVSTFRLISFSKTDWDNALRGLAFVSKINYAKKNWTEVKWTEIDWKKTDRNLLKFFLCAFQFRFSSYREEMKEKKRLNWFESVSSSVFDECNVSLRFQLFHVFYGHRPKWTREHRHFHPLSPTHRS